MNTITDIFRRQQASAADALVAAEAALAGALERRHATRRALAVAEATLEVHRAHFRILLLPARIAKPTLQQQADEVALLESDLRGGSADNHTWAAALKQYDRCKQDADQAEIQWQVAQLRYDTQRRVLRDGGPDGS